MTLKKYAGIYNNDVYGAAKVTEENGKLVAHLGPGLTGDLEHWHFDTLMADGEVKSMTIEQGSALSLTLLRK